MSRLRNIETDALLRRIAHLDSDRAEDLRAEVANALERVDIRVELERRKATRDTDPPRREGAE